MRRPALVGGAVAGRGGGWGGDDAEVLRWSGSLGVWLGFGSTKPGSLMATWHTEEFPSDIGQIALSDERAQADTLLVRGSCEAVGLRPVGTASSGSLARSQLQVHAPPVGGPRAPW